MQVYYIYIYYNFYACDAVTLLLSRTLGYPVSRMDMDIIYICYIYVGADHVLDECTASSAEHNGLKTLTAYRLSHVLS